MIFWGYERGPELKHPKASNRAIALLVGDDLGPKCRSWFERSIGTSLDQLPNDELCRASLSAFAD